MRGRAPFLIAACSLALSAAGPPPRPMQEWPFYGGDQGGTKHSQLADIDRDNVGRLKLGPDGARYVVDYYRKSIEHPEWTSTEAARSPDLNISNQDSSGCRLSRLWQ